MHEVTISEVLISAHFFHCLFSSRAANLINHCKWILEAKRWKEIRGNLEAAFSNIHDPTLMKRQQRPSTFAENQLSWSDDSDGHRVHCEIQSNS